MPSVKTTAFYFYCNIYTGKTEMAEIYIRPTKEYLPSYYEACKETWGNVHNDYILHNPENFAKWKNTIFDDYKKQENGIDLPRDYVPSATYWIIEDNEYIGTINFRLKLNDNLLNYGGHIGTVIRTGKRNKSYGKKALEWSLREAKKLNISPVLLTCHENNIPSLKILTLSNYYKMEKDSIIDNEKIINIRRFWYK